MQISKAVKTYLSQKNWEYRNNKDGKNLDIKTCPFCTKSKWKFSIVAASGVYRCWTCNESGSLYKLKEALGDLGEHTEKSVNKKNKSKKDIVPRARIDKWHNALLKDEDALNYLFDRGITQEAIEYFQLGKRLQGGKAWLTIPHINDGVVYNIKRRTLPPEKKDFRRVADAETVLFNADALDKYETIIVAEAELDAISWWCAGVKNVVSLTAGAGSFLSEWYDLLKEKKVILALDSDSQGKNGAKDIARRLGFDCTKTIDLPLHDANDVLVEYGGAALADLISTAHLFDVDGVYTIREVLSECVQRSDDVSGIFTPWESVNRRLGKFGFQYGDMVVLSAPPKTGKTTLAQNIVGWNAEVKNVPSLMFCLEMKTTRLGKKYASAVRRKPVDDLTALDLKLVRYKLKNMPLWMVDPSWDKKVTLDSVVEKIRETVKRYGIKLLVFDHLHFLCRSLRYVTMEVGNVTKAFKLLAEELDIVVILIAQPTKIKDGRMMTAQDLKHSSDIHADADWILLMHRDAVPAGTIANSRSVDASQEILSPKTLLRIEAARFAGGGETYLHYAGAISSFFDMDNIPSWV